MKRETREAVEKSREAAGSASDALNAKKDDVEAELRDMVDQMKEEVAILENKLDSFAGEGRGRMKSALEDLRQKKARLNEELENVQEASADNWSDVKDSGRDLLASTKAWWEGVKKELRQ